MLVLGFATRAWSVPISVTELFIENNPEVDLLQTTPGTEYVYFQALRSVKLVDLIVFGEPVGYIQGVSDFRWQLFKTTPDWQTPNGNADRLFFQQVFFNDAGRADYETPADVMLRARSHYRLSFQVSNVNWIQPYHTIAEDAAPFTTDDGRFLVYGFGQPPVGPLPFRTPTYSLRIQAVPEPSTLLLLFACVLFGFAAYSHGTTSERGRNRARG